MSVGQWAYLAGNEGTITIPANARLATIRCDSAAGGTLVIAGGATITISAGVPFVEQLPLAGLISQSTSYTLVFTNTDAYYVSYMTPS